MTRSNPIARRGCAQRRRHLPALFTLMLAVSCGKEQPAVPVESTTFASSLGVSLASSTKLPGGLYYRDAKVGTGAILQDGQTVSMRYVGSLADGTVFDSNPAPKAPFSFRLGAGQVIRGWDEGLIGMKVGGTRQLIIPSELGYGAKAVGPIPPNSVLVFIVDALGAR